MEIVINKCYGGFSLSLDAVKRYAEIKGLTLYPEKDKHGFHTYWTVPKQGRVKELKGGWMTHSEEARKEYNRKYGEQTIYDRSIPRDDPALVQVVRELGDMANGEHAKLAVVEIPNGVSWEIVEYDGHEHIAESHSTWY